MENNAPVTENELNFPVLPRAKAQIFIALSQTGIKSIFDHLTVHLNHEHDVFRYLRTEINRKGSLPWLTFYKGNGNENEQQNYIVVMVLKIHFKHKNTSN